MQSMIYICYNFGHDFGRESKGVHEYRQRMLDGGVVEALEGLETATASKTLMKQPAVLARPPL